MSTTTDAPSTTPFDALMDAAVDAIVIIDRQGSFSASTGAEMLFGYSEAEVRDRT